MKYPLQSYLKCQSCMKGRTLTLKWLIIKCHNRQLQKMFLTQVNQFKRSSSAHCSGARSTKSGGLLSNKSSTTDLTNNKHGNHVSLHRAASSFGMDKVQRDAKIILGRFSPEQKWRRIVELFQPIEDETYCLLKADLVKGNFKFQIPETVLVDQQSTLQLLYSPKNHICKRPITKPEVASIIEKGHENMIKVLKQTNRYNLYGESVDITVNPNALFVTIRWQEAGRSIQVQNIRNFGQNRWRASSQCLLQRYVYSRNLKAMILRVSFTKAQRGQQHQQYCLHRFQNIASIFRNNTNDSHDLRAKVSPSLQRPNTLQYSKISGPGALQKLISPASQVRRLLQSITGKRVIKLSVDFIEDLTGNIWVIGFKGAVFEQVIKIEKKEQWLIASQVGYCRLCNGLFQKNELQNNVSVRMLLEFLHHLKRRTRIQDLGSIQFESALSLNRKENAMSAVCQCCYSLIIHQLQLKKYQRKLGKLCHIRVEDEADTSKGDGGQLRQWRLMAYLQQIKEANNGIGRLENVTIRYSLGRGIQQKWKCNLEQGSIPVKKVKIHYFFSESQDIEDFLKNSEIVISVLTSQGQDVLAQGSTGVLANFKNKFTAENGQRQTTTVLLFFQSGKYCELTLKVGLVYDGIYRSPEVPLRKFHSILFPTRDCLNSNPLPKQWMQAFGFDQQIPSKDLKYEEIFKKQKQVGSKLKKRPIRYFD